MSWFSRPNKNRRLKQKHVLDVKLRVQPLKAVRLRLAAMAIAASFAVIFGIFVAWQGGQWAISEFLYSNDAFAIETIEVQTDGVVPIEQLKRWSGVKAGDNLLALDLTRIKRDLELVPLIEAAAVERVLPRTLRLTITEREPVAQVHLFESGTNGLVASRIFFIDQNGYVMTPLLVDGKTVPASRDWLPTITGVPGNELRPGWPITTPEVRAALTFIADFEKSQLMQAVDIRFIDASNPNTLQITTEQGGDITLGLNDFPAQLRRWRSVYDLGSRSNKSLASLDLAVANFVPARWLEDPPVVPGRKPKSSNSSPYRKRHV
jgi:cell division septal protein FtsQ